MIRERCTACGYCPTEDLREVTIAMDTGRRNTEFDCTVCGHFVARLEEAEGINLPEEAIIYSC